MVILKLYVQIGWYQNNIGFLKWAPKDIKDIVNVGTKAIELGEFWTGKLNYEANWWCLLYQKMKLFFFFFLLCKKINKNEANWWSAGWFKYWPTKTKLFN